MTKKVVNNDPNAGERLKRIITKLTLSQSYWGYLFSRIRRVPIPGGFESIMGVGPTRDGVMQLYYDPDLVMTTGEEELRWILQHEGMHVLNKHASRFIRLKADTIDEKKIEKITRVFNIAADCAVNSQIDMPKQLLVGGKAWTLRHPEQFKLKEKQATEYYYNNIIDKLKFVYIEGGSDGSGKSDDKGSYHGKSSGDGKGGKKVTIEDLEGMADQIDDHSTWKDVADGVADPYSLSRKVDNYITTIIKDSAKHFNKLRGTLPGYIADLIEQALMPPKVPYYQIIQKLVKGSRLSKFRRDCGRINRKRTYVFQIGEQNVPLISPFPGKSKDFSFKIGVCIDTSGSMSPDDIREGLSGIKNIIENDRHTETWVIEIDTVIQKEYQVKKVQDIDFKVEGRGGTTLFAGLERCREKNVDVCLFFTDGCCEDMRRYPRRLFPKKTIWVITKGGTIENVLRTGYVIDIGDK